jgi:mono/diheme cytochrome c family protein
MNFQRFPSERVLAILCLAFAGTLFGAQTAADPTATFQKYCAGCHGKSNATAGVSLTKLAADPAWGENLQQWEKVASALEQKRMPPPKMPQPSDAQRAQAAQWVRANLNEYAEKHAGDPGRVTVRRLTTGEYTYTIQDLTGLDLKFDSDFPSDSVGGEGFATFGDVQFMDDANLERYLEAAKRVSSHAIIGAGPLSFFEHPGKSGFEMSAVARIQKIYTTNGFRTVAGEGARPYGLDLYGKAFFAAWRYQHRRKLGEPKTATLEQIAVRNGVSARLARHVWTVVHEPSPSYPISDIAARFRKLPAPAGPDDTAAAKKGAEDLGRVVIEWPRFLFAAGPMESTVGDDRVFLLTDESLTVHPKEKLRLIARAPKGQKTARVYLTVMQMNPRAKSAPAVLWRNGVVRTRKRMDRREAPASQPLNAVLSEDTRNRLGFGQGTDEKSFSMATGTTQFFDIPVPEGAVGVEVIFDTEVAAGDAADSVLRVTVSEKPELGKGRTSPALLGNVNHHGFRAWKAGLLEFAARLPQNSQGEVTPSDRDPIPLPFNNTYNQPERDRFHTQVKYYRTDQFLVQHVLDDATRTRLDQAWSDLRQSFDFHDSMLRFIADKYKLELKTLEIAKLSLADIHALPAEPRKFVEALRAEYDADGKAARAARPGQVEDCVRFASKAWRRPLSKAEEDSLRSFYRKLRTGPETEHPEAIRSLLARILVAPAFLYRLEQPSTLSSDRQLSDWEVANRLSYFLWSSMPDQELRRAASARELSTPQGIERQTRRMLTDPKARRFATEFFGQWLGFYRFDQHRGVDTMRFPEFTDQVKSDMYDEAIAFFEHIVRTDRPVHETFSADYTFLTQALAKHYGISAEIKSKDVPEMVEGANAFHRGGVLRLGAVLTATSAPLRTSPVKRGDWVLRRILGTPTPPPPPDAGSLPGDEKAFGGLTLFEKLEVHKRNPTCATCHVRIDPMGFPLERFDAVGRWRDKYTDGSPVHDSSDLPDKSRISGIDGLLAYLKTQEPQVLKNFSTKLVGYALGRTVQASDQPLIRTMVKRGADATVSSLITDVVTSRQFRYRRDRQERGAPHAPAEQSAAIPGTKNTNKEGGL